MRQPEDTQTADLLEATTKRGRKPLPAADTATVEIDSAVLESDARDATALVLREAEIVQSYGDGLAYERDRVVNETQFFMAQSAEAMLEVGKRLIQIKEHEPHGEFTAIVVNRLGIGERTARAMMAAAAKYLAPTLEGKRKTFSVLGRAKMFELMTEDDGDLEALAAGGTLAGLKIDEIDAMSVRELKVALRDYKQIIEAKDKVLADRNAKVDRLEEKLAKPYKPGKDAAARSSKEKIFLDALEESAMKMKGLMTTVTEVMTDMGNEGVSQSCLQAAHVNLQWLAHSLAEVMTTHGIELDLAELVEPTWVREAKKRAANANA